MLTMFQHFNDLETIERNHKDVRDYLKLKTVKMNESAKKEIKTLIYERSLPIIYKPKGKEKEVDQLISDLSHEINELEKLLI